MAARTTGIIALTVALSSLVASQTGPQVTIPGLGTLEGDVAASYVNGRTYYRFRGVPYAAPPLGAYRFKPPGPVQPWAGVYNATMSGQSCPQGSYAFTFESEDEDYRASDELEDCLFINVYTPQLTAGADLPVIVYFHGGHYVSGSNRPFDAKKFMDQDLVIVVPQYRLGALGFLSLDTDDIPGNAGMFDQAAAVEWVRDHVSVFGGDPTKVTIMGQSAGGVSAALLNISPLTTGLFQQVIGQSGSATAFWGIERDPLRAAVELGRILNCPSLDIPTLTICFQTASAADLVNARNTFETMERLAGRNGYAGMAPVIQKAGSVRFLDREPREILQEGSYVPKPAMFGANKHEGSLIHSMMHSDFLQPNNLLGDSVYFKRGFTNYMLSYFGVKDQGETLASGVEKSYIGINNVGNYTAMYGGIIDFTGDMYLKGPSYEGALYNSMFAATYLYSFNFLGERSVWPVIGDPDLTSGGVCHGNELLLQFELPGFILGEQDRIMSKKIVKLWYNFAKYGDPNPSANPVEEIPTWPTFDGSVDGWYMRLDNTSLPMQDFSKNEYFIAMDEAFPWTK